MEGFMDTMFKDSTGNTFDAPAQPLVNFVIGDCVSVGNICGATLVQQPAATRHVLSDGAFLHGKDRYNKHLAVWHTGRLIREWARGIVSMGVRWGGAC
ncbi:Uncharacterized protein HZ326_25771 [Fusarium oxysporum f. sp. albedinis]|nr:Uncharacterized protein HZ326_25771 [Fusarium oxysporum f. sp. albedinis]